MSKQNVIQEQYENAKRICGAIRGRTKHEGFRVGHLEYRELDLTISLIPDLLDTIEQLRAELEQYRQSEKDGRLLPEGYLCVALSDGKTVGIFHAPGKVVMVEKVHYYQTSETEHEATLGIPTRADAEQALKGLE